MAWSFTAVAVQQTAGTVSFVCGPQRWRKFGRRCQQLCGASGLLFLNVAGCQRTYALFRHLVPHIITAVSRYTSAVALLTSNESGTDGPERRSHPMLAAAVCPRLKTMMVRDRPAGAAAPITKSPVPPQ